MSDSLQTLEGKIEPVELEDEMRSSFIDYAMSVLTDRALPDVRDGLKPSQRRILVAMNDLGLAPNKQHRKCAKIAGDTSGNYHPHGEAVIYPTLGLVNEAGEVAGKIKKVFRDKDGEISAETREALKAELGDVLWYLAQTCTELEISLDEVAESNLTKLLDRQARGKIQGDGDNR